MHFTSETSANGISERLFDLDVGGERVPGVIWSPDGAAGKRPLLLMGHGGSQHKKAPGVMVRAHRYVTNLGFAVVAIDAPSEGGRVVSEQAAQFVAQLRKNMAEGKSVGIELMHEMARRAIQAIPEWRATLDAVQTLDFVGADGPVGYWGLSMGAAIGVPFVAEEPRIAAAVFGLTGLLPGNEDLARAAARITVPVELAIQWGDELVPREAGLALFDALGSKEKTLHINPGGHVGIMPMFETESWERFFARHLVKAG